MPFSSVLMFTDCFVILPCNDGVSIVFPVISSISIVSIVSVLSIVSASFAGFG